MQSRLLDGAPTMVLTTGSEPTAGTRLGERMASSGSSVAPTNAAWRPWDHRMQACQWYLTSSSPSKILRFMFLRSGRSSSLPTVGPCSSDLADREDATVIHFDCTLIALR